MDSGISVTDSDRRRAKAFLRSVERYNLNLSANKEAFVTNLSNEFAKVRDVAVKNLVLVMESPQPLKVNKQYTTFDAVPQADGDSTEPVTPMSD